MLNNDNVNDKINLFHICIMKLFLLVDLFVGTRCNCFLYFYVGALVINHKIFSEWVNQTGTSVAQTTLTQITTQSLFTDHCEQSKGSETVF